MAKRRTASSTGDPGLSVFLPQKERDGYQHHDKRTSQNANSAQVFDNVGVIGVETSCLGAGSAVGLGADNRHC